MTQLVLYGCRQQKLSGLPGGWQVSEIRRCSAQKQQHSSVSYMYMYTFKSVHTVVHDIHVVECSSMYIISPE